MSIKSKIAAVAAASIGMVLTQSSALRAEPEDNSAPEKVTKIAAPIDVNEIFYSAIPDEALEREAASKSPYTLVTGVGCCIAQPIKKPPVGGLKTGPTTVPPKSIQQNKNK